ncbi:MAG: TolC family protein, partial [Planctomycetota bacterium]
MTNRFLIYLILMLFAVGVPASESEKPDVDPASKTQPAAAAPLNGSPVHHHAPKPFFMQDAVLLALQNNYGLVSAKLNETSALADYYGAREAFAPRIDTSFYTYVKPTFTVKPTSATTVRLTKPLESGGSASVSLSSNNTIDGNAASASNTLSFSLSQPLVSGGMEETLLRLRTSELTLETRRASLEREAQRLVYTVTDQYLAIIRQKMTLELTQRSVDRAREFLEFMLAKKSSDNEVKNARVQLLRRELSYRRAEKQVEVTNDSLRRTLGVEADFNLETVGQGYTLKAWPDAPIRAFIIDEANQSVDVAYFKMAETGERVEVRRLTIYKAQIFDEAMLTKIALENRAELETARLAMRDAELRLDARRAAADHRINYTLGYNRYGNSPENIIDSFNLRPNTLSFGLNY